MASGNWVTIENSSDEDEEYDEEPVQTAPNVRGHQNVTVTGGPGSVININCTQPNDRYSSHGVDKVDTLDGIFLSIDAESDADMMNAAHGTEVDSVLFHNMMSLPIPCPVRKPEQRRLVLVGYTGGGKSETGNSILCNRDLFESDPGFSSVTKVCRKFTGKDLRYTDRSTEADEVVVVDTPGLFDTNEEPEVIAKTITECIINASPGPHAILVVTPIRRLTSEIQTAVDGLKKLFGDRCLQYMILVFTHLDSIKRKKNNKGIEEMLTKAPPPLCRILQECNSRYVAFDNTLDADSKENKDQVTQLLDLIDDMIERNDGQYYTNELLEEANRWMEREKKRYEKEIEEKFNAREGRIRAEYEKHMDDIEQKQIQLEEVQEKRRELEEKKIKDLQTKIDVLQFQIHQKQEQHDEVLEERTKHKDDLKLMEKNLEDLQLSMMNVESDKNKYRQREKKLSRELKKARKDRDQSAKYLEELTYEFGRKLKFDIDLSKPPKTIVEEVTKKSKLCFIL